MTRLRLLPLTVAAMAGLGLVKAEAVWRGAWTPASVVAPPALAGIVPPARAQEAVPPARAQEAVPPPARAQQAVPPARAPSTAQPAAPHAAVPVLADPQAATERGVLEALRQRRTEIESREAQVLLRETVLAATERRLAQRVEELTALQRRLEVLESGRGEREEASWRGLVRTYETMRPRDAAAIFDEMEMPVLVQIIDRMGERRAAPVMGAMRPDRARLVTAELARHRNQRSAPQ